MPAQSCDGCGRRITVAGGIANVWSFGEGRATEGTAMTLEFEDGSTHRLCFPCIERLPEEPTAADVRAIDERGPDDEESREPTS